MTMDDCHCCTDRDIEGTDGHKLLEKEMRKMSIQKKLAVTNSEIFMPRVTNKIVKESPI
jgi:hypothetical protein